MRSTALLLLALTLRLNTAAIAAEILDEAQAIREIERLGGKVTRDATLPGRPVTVVCFGAESKFEDMDVPLFKPLTKLATLDLSQTKMSGTHIRGAGLRSLRELKHLTQLNLAHTQISDTGLREIKELQNLTVLCLEGTQVTDAGLNEIKSLEKLKNLNLRHTGVTGAGLDELRHSLPNATIFPFVPFRAAEKLRESEAIGEIVRLGGTIERDDTLPGRSVTGVAFRVGSDVGDEDVALLRPFTELKKLELSGTEIAPAGLKQLSRMNNLTSLSLNSTRIGDRGLKELKGLKNLTTLDINRAGITDAGLKELAQLENLTTLNLGNIQVNRFRIEGAQTAQASDGPRSQ